MVGTDARIALRFTLQEIAEFFGTPMSSRAPAEPAHLLAACVPVLYGLGCPYDLTRLDSERPAVGHFILRVEGTPEPWTSHFPPTLVATLTDIADYLLHLSRGGKGNYAMENYVSSQCVRLLDQLGIPQAPGNPPA